MADYETKRLRETLSVYVDRSTPLALGLFFIDCLLYIASVAATVLWVPVWAKALASISAGLIIAKLFVIGHDAAHGSYTENRNLNALIGRLSFLPSLHNYSLWQVAHNRLHHRANNFKGENSWSPLSQLEYARLPAWRRLVERLYRSPVGFGAYYLIERWWKDKFFPRPNEFTKGRSEFWIDFAAVASFLVLFLGLLVTGGLISGTASPGSAILWGFIVPFAIWNSAMGMTVYLQHTHPQVPWFSSEEEWDRLGKSEELTVHLVMPKWYSYLTHHIMEHPAHHVHMKIPLYRLRAAQRHLNILMGERAVIQPFSLHFLLSTVKACKLYNYTLHCWTDFKGRPTSGWLVRPEQELSTEGLASVS